MNGFLIAGTNSGCGKTTVTIGLMALLKTMGKQVAPFKTGPDFIDPLFHSEVLQTPSYNLDSFMLPEKVIQHLYAEHSQTKEIAIIEGVMGMYDGMGVNSKGCSYELSKLLKLPILLVVNCKGLYQSVVAIVKGYATLKTDANIKGIILNQVPNNNTFQFLKALIERECAIPCLGYLPTTKAFKLESRHLGLIQAEEVDQLPQIVQQLTSTLSQTIDIQKLLEISKIESIKKTSVQIPDLDLSNLQIGVAHDKAFRFYYKDNLELLEKLGATLHFFSPLKSKEIPVECNCLYIGGGYPEVFAKELSANNELLKKIKIASQKGMPIYAECGGLMYLTKAIIDTNGEQHNMANVYSASIQMTEELQHFGYANVKYNGIEAKCHEFHRSKVIHNTSNMNYTLEYQLCKPEKQQEWQCGLKTANCLAAYAHVHFYSNFQFFEQIVQLWKTKTM